jgi:hypothetical protein
MIDWSVRAIRFTSGIGALCMAALAAELTCQLIPMWLALSLIMVPVAVFIIMRPDDMPLKFVWPCQLAASLWYLALACILSVLFFHVPVRMQGWPILFVGMAIGAIPCVVVLSRIVRNLELSPRRGKSESEDLMSRIPPMRRQQFKLLEAAEKCIFKWAAQHHVPLHRVELVVPFVETDFDVTVWLFYTTDDELYNTGEQGRAKISAAFRDTLKSLRYPADWLEGIKFVFDSHEHVERDFEGNYGSSGNRVGRS